VSVIDSREPFVNRREAEVKAGPTVAPQPPSV
jgi:hypothetical protein